MGGHVLMSLLKTTVLLDVVKVVTADDDGSGHFGLQNNSGEDVSADGYVTSERTFLIDVLSIDSLKHKI